MRTLVFALIFLLSGCAHTRVSAVSPAGARLAALATAAGMGGFGYAALSKETPYWWVVTAPLSLICGWVMHEVMYSFTPESKFQAAQSFVMQLSNNAVAMYAFDNEDELIDTLHDIYVLHDLWLVRAYHDMTTLLERATHHLQCVKDARKARYGDHMFARICNEIIKRLDVSISNLVNAVKVVKNHPEYMEQLKLYKEMQAKERELQAQQMMAYAQLQSAIAQTHAAYNNDRSDRD